LKVDQKPRSVEGDLFWEKLGSFSIVDKVNTGCLISSFIVLNFHKTVIFWNLNFGFKNFNTGGKQTSDWKYKTKFFAGIKLKYLYQFFAMEFKIISWMLKF